ncbi:hypothetical protein JCM14076_24740 [Methylosoma difficile]
MKILVLIFLASSAFFANAHAGLATDKQLINTACWQEAKIANCGPEQVGQGLLNCLKAYPFKGLSAICMNAINRFNADKIGTLAVSPVVIVRPSYPIPGPGYLWRLHPRYGWGWYHPRFGWHYGWQ